MAPSKVAPDNMALLKLECFKSVALKLALLMSAPLRLTLIKLVCANSRPLKSAPR